MAKRMILMLLGVTVFIAAIGFVKFQQVQAAMSEAASFQPPPEAVTTLVAGTESWPATLSAIGTVEAVHGVTVSADLPGIVERITFESGRPVQAGAVLVTLDSRQERAQLAAAEAQLDLARVQLERMRGLKEKGVIALAEFDRVDAEHKQAEARVGEIRAAIARKTIRAPFSGVLGIRQVDLGQYLNAGDPVVPLQSLDPIYVDFAVPQQQVARLDPGVPVEVTAEGIAEGGAEDGGALRGEITAVDSVVDPATRNVGVQARLANPGGRLRPGMFVEARVVLDASTPVVALPASAVSYAPYGDSVFVVEELRRPEGASYLGVRQQFVKLGGGRGDQVAVLDGVVPGDEVVTSGVFKLRNGAAVVVDNEVQPGNDPTPQPQDS